MGWQFLDSVGIGDGCRCLCRHVYDNNLIAGGDFITAGGVGASHIAAWNGSSWAALGSGTSGRVMALAVYDGKLIAGGSFATAGGVSANNIAIWDGSAWSAMGSGMNDTVFTLKIYDNNLIAGGRFTSAGGKVAAYLTAWTKGNTTGIAEGDISRQPNDYCVIQNYLNPFNQTTSFEFETPKAGHVKVEIFNLLGQLVDVLAERNFGVGRHTIFWDGRDYSGKEVSTGLYFYRITSRDFVESKKMLLLK